VVEQWQKDRNPIFFMPPATTETGRAFPRPATH
jgi:hypothetical protein